MLELSTETENEKIVGIIDPGEMVQKLMGMSPEEVDAELFKITNDQAALICPIALMTPVPSKNGVTQILPGQGLVVFKDLIKANPKAALKQIIAPVSYTHLTLPTICSV